MGLWLALDNFFYLLNFSHIEAARSFGAALYFAKSEHVQRVQARLSHGCRRGGRLAKKNAAECILWLERMKAYSKDTMHG